MRHLKILLLIFLCLFSINSYAQEKYRVIDKSSRKPPVWNNSSLKEFIITSAISSDIELAKQECLDNLRKQFIETVGITIKNSSGSSINLTIINNKITEFIDALKDDIETKSAKVPFITNISLSNIEEYYWEKRRKKSDKTEYYYYTIKYPLPTEQLDEMVEMFLASDAKMDEMLTTLEDRYTKIGSVEEIDVAINNLSTLEKYFFDEVRLNRTKAAMVNYQNVYEKIGITIVAKELGKKQIALTYGDNLLKYDKAPEVSSNTANKLAVAKSGDIWDITYDYSTCHAEEANYIDVIWSVKENMLKEKFNIEISISDVNIQPIGEIYITSRNIEYAKIDTLQVDITNNKTDEEEPKKVISVSDIELTIKIESFNSKKSTIQSISIKNVYSQNGFTFDNINYEISRKGIHTIIAVPKNSYIISKQSPLQSKLSIGIIQIKNNKGEIETIHFALPTIINW